MVNVFTSQNDKTNLQAFVRFINILICLIALNIQMQITNGENVKRFELLIKFRRTLIFQPKSNRITDQLTLSSVWLFSDLHRTTKHLS